MLMHHYEDCNPNQVGIVAPHPLFVAHQHRLINGFFYWYNTNSIKLVVITKQYIVHGYNITN